ncbi:MAG: hypothetical protein Q7T55_03070, partial [Solirubrobacteraceae bacterium]|nr:hypothetical protein [Solirubrobacteraceae bacterium]
MNESHPWRDGSQTILFVLAMPVVLLLAYVVEHLVGWASYATADARERRRQRFHLLAVGSVVTLVVGIGTGDPTPTLIVA